VAAGVWRDCQHLVRAFGLAVEIRQDVPAGLAILRVPPVAVVQGWPSLARSWAIVTGRAMSGDAIRGASRAAGRLLRRVGLR